MKRKWRECVSPPALSQSDPSWPWDELGVRVFCFGLHIPSLEMATGHCLVAHRNPKEVKAEAEEPQHLPCAPAMGPEG